MQLRLDVEWYYLINTVELSNSISVFNSYITIVYLVLEVVLDSDKLVVSLRVTKSEQTRELLRYHFLGEAITLLVIQNYLEMAIQNKQKFNLSDGILWDVAGVPAVGR
jgi:hypothetical protein